jgi:hypothetical protein
MTSGLNASFREAALAVEQKVFDDVRASVLAHNIATDVRENALNTRAMEVAYREGGWLSSR